MSLFDISLQTKFAVDSLTVMNGHLEVPLKKQHGAVLLWLNDEEAKADPIWEKLGGDRNAYIEHLLETCAYKIDVGGRDPDRIGVADRYGGSGIGSNGGSGRSVMIGPYYVKGVGQTPLIGLGVRADHASGGAYLEECVRETLLAEILHHELPFGAVRTLAIIATGDIQVWTTEQGVKPERCCLLVRRAFLRPGHIERAALYRGTEDLPGMADAHRVRCMISALEAYTGKTYLLQEQLIVGFARWSRQLAASYLLCLPHGGISSSNVAIDGRLVDFGATAGVPSLARYWMGEGHHLSGDESRDIINTINGIACAFRFTAGNGHLIDVWLARAQDQVLRAYSESLHKTLLCLLGFSAVHIQAMLVGRVGRIISRKLDLWLNPLRRRTCSILEGAPWHLQTMPEMSALEALEAELIRIACEVGINMPKLSADSAEERREIRSRWIAPRIRLDRDRLKDECYTRIEGEHLGAVDVWKLRDAITKLINEIVAKETRFSLKLRVQFD